MKLCRFLSPNGDLALGAVVGDDVYRVDGLAHGWTHLADFLRWSVGRRDVVERIAELIRNQAPAAQWTSLADAGEGAPARLLAPIDLQEVWAAGVTYRRSREAREEESKGSGIYDRVYDAARPEIFFKATP